MTSAELSVAFFLQMSFILAACRVVGWVARRCGQPHEWVYGKKARATGELGAI